MAGRSIRLFLVDGTPQGIRTAEVGNWTGLALVAPRTDLAQFQRRGELSRTGVYLLLGSQEETGLLPVYVGEGDEVRNRLRAHHADENRDWWTWVVVFVSKDENLTKAHVRWLESKIVSEIAEAKRAELRNGNGPIGGRLPEADQADMETFFENIRLLLPTLGANIFSREALPAPTAARTEDVRLELKWEDARAECLVEDGQFIVQKGSTARITEVDSLAGYLRERRRKLREAGVLVPHGTNPELLRFSQDYAFDSPSMAAGAVSGTGLNGRFSWKVKGLGIAYKEWQAQQVAKAEVGSNGDCEQS